MGFTDFIRGVATVLPEVPKPARRPSITERLVWTAIALAIYLVMAETPLYGLPSRGGADPFAYTRIIFASTQGSLMELGIGPIVTAGLILQLLKGAEIIKLDFKKPEDRSLFTSATKFLTIIVIVAEGSAYIIGGVLGPNITASIGFVLLLQLIAAGIFVMLLDELVQKGWGIGSGVSLFILAGVAQRLVWEIFTPIPYFRGQGASEPTGFVPFVFHALANGNAWQAVFRDYRLPSLYSLLLTLAAILIIVYVEGIRIELPIASTQYRGFKGVYPMKLLYVSNVPVILVSALSANVVFFTQLVQFRLNPGGANPWLNLLGHYNATNPGQPVGGLVYYVTSPRDFLTALHDPIRAITFVAFMVGFSVLFAKIWVEIGGLSPESVAKSLLDAKVQIPGFRRSQEPIADLLGRFIPVITVLGGLFIGLLASLSDIFGVIGGGIGILLMIDILIQYYQLLVRERIEEMMPALGAFLGRE